MKKLIIGIGIGFFSSDVKSWGGVGLLGLRIASLTTEGSSSSSYTKPPNARFIFVKNHSRNARTSTSRMMKKGKKSENRSNPEARKPTILTPKGVFQHPASSSNPGNAAGIVMTPDHSYSACVLTGVRT